MSNPIVISPTTARRLAVRSQWLDRLPEQPDKEAILAVIRQLGCLQIDPLNVVARSPLLVLFSRLGPYQTADLDELLWEDRLLFEYWAHAASIVLVEDFPLHELQMRNFSRGNGDWAERIRSWLEVNEPFHKYIKEAMAERGPLFAKEIEDRSVQSWESSGWTNTRNVSTMLGLLWEQGDITVTRREGAGFGLKKQWGLFEQHMPQWVDHISLPEEDIVRQAAQLSLKALGVATEKHINNYFIRGGYPNLTTALRELEEDGRILPVTIHEDGQDWAGQWFIHADLLPDLQQVQEGYVSSRTVLLSPFDNLIADRERTEMLFDFYYRSEIYTPQAKRIFGYYVLPILHGERLIGRIDPKFDRKTNILHVYAVHAEDGAPDTSATGQAVAGEIQQLGRFLGAQEIQFSGKKPSAWAAALVDQRL